MLNVKSVVLLALLHLIVSSGEKLPEFFKICKKSSVNLSKCIEDNGNFALPYILKGVKELNIPPLKHLKVPKIYSAIYFPYDFNFNGSIRNLEGVSFKDVVFDPKYFMSRAKLIFPKLVLAGDYKIHGFVNVIPITGKGPASVTLNNVTVEIMWGFARVKRFELDYFKEVSTSLVSFNVSSISYNFRNLFDGNKTQEKAANKLLNEHWWILAGNFLPHVPNYLVELAFKVTNLVHRNTAIDEVFSPY